MVGGGILGMAAHTVNGIDCGVVENGACPGRGAVAGRTLPGKVVGRGVLGMTAGAVRSSRGSVVETGRLPGICVMAFRALAWEVVGRNIFGMAAGTVGRVDRLVVEGCRHPGIRGMAEAAFTLEVVSGCVFSMARRAAGRRSDKNPIGMARAAINTRMFSGQWPEGVHGTCASRRELNHLWIDWNLGWGRSGSCRQSLRQGRNSGRSGFWVIAHDRAERLSRISCNSHGVRHQYFQSLIYTGRFHRCDL